MSAFQRRSFLLKTNDVPGQHETTDSLGETLGKTVLKTMSPVAQDLMGVKKPLSTAPSQMWVDPNDLLNGNVVIRPPTTSACLKAFTHQKILELGMDIEQKIQHETAVLVDHAIGDTTEFERFECNNKVDFAVRQGQEELRSVLVSQRTELLNIFQDDRQQMIEEHAETANKLVESLNEEHKLATLKKTLELRMEYEHRISGLEIKLQESQQKHENDTDELKQQMNKAIQTTRTEYFDLMKKLHGEFKQRLEEQKNQLQCQHMSEMMHVICAEKTDAQKKLLKLQQGQREKKNRIQQSTLSVIDSKEFDENPAIATTESLSSSSNSKSNLVSSHPKNSTKCVQTERESSDSFLHACIKDAAIKPAFRPFVIGACEIAQLPSVSTSVSSDSIALESSLSSLEYDNCRYVKMTTTAIDPRLLRPRECDEVDDISWKTVTDEKSNVSLAQPDYGSMHNLVLDYNENTTIVKIRSKLINILETVNQLHPMTESLELVRNQIGSLINDLIDNTDSPTSTIATVIPPLQPSKLLSTTDSYELIPLRKPVNAETFTLPPSEKVDITTTKDNADHMIRVKNLQLTSDEYLESKKSFPTYMRPQRNTSACLFSYTPTTETEWKSLLQDLHGNETKNTQELCDTASEDQDGETEINEIMPIDTERSRLNSMSDTLNNSRPNPILRKVKKTKVTVRSLLQLLERGDDDIAEQFFGRIPKSE